VLPEGKGDVVDRLQVDGHVALVKGDLQGIVRARLLSRGTLRNIRQNLFFAFVYNAIGILIAAGVLYPAFGLLLSHDRERGDELRLAVGDRERAPAALLRHFL
jgi:hypothetical protein